MSAMDDNKKLSMVSVDFYRHANGGTVRGIEYYPQEQRGIVLLASSGNTDNTVKMLRDNGIEASSRAGLYHAMDGRSYMAIDFSGPVQDVQGVLESCRDHVKPVVGTHTSTYVNGNGIREQEEVPSFDASYDAVWQRLSPEQLACEAASAGAGRA